MLCMMFLHPKQRLVQRLQTGSVARWYLLAADSAKMSCAPILKNAWCPVKQNSLVVKRIFEGRDSAGLITQICELLHQYNLGTREPNSVFRSKFTVKLLSCLWKNPLLRKLSRRISEYIHRQTFSAQMLNRVDISMQQ